MRRASILPMRSPAAVQHAALAGGPGLGRKVSAGILVGSLLVMGLAACERPTVDDALYRPRVAPVEVSPAIHRAADQGRVRLLRPDLLPPEIRGPTQIDGFVQDDAIVDILWVVDNSGSMDNERARIAAAFQRFIASLDSEQVDYHIGVTTTDMRQTGPGFRGELIGPPTVISRDTPDPVGTFTDHVTLPPSRVEDEQGFAAALAAVTEPMRSGPNAGFLRDEADLAIIVVSDEDDGSLGEPEHYVRRFRSLKGPGNEDTVTFSAVIGDVPDGCVSPGDENILWADAEPGVRYEKAAALTGGIVASVCSASFDRTLERLGLAFSGLRRIFPLSAIPIESSIRVEVDGVPIPRNPMTGWGYDAATRSITFLGRYVPPPGAEILIRYDLDV
ncbi:MAG: VWA domain-containing protein [Deltaproteobacteria bacterium]|nr:MAG: VWA domain-containing protein [Deltaproteobacteria bacterium]